MSPLKHPGWSAPVDAIRRSVSAASAIQPIRDGAIRVLDAIQFTPPANQLDSLFVLAVAMATVVGLDPHEMVARARRIIPDAELFSENMRATRDYAKGELK
jgi:hypothetical protein